MNEQQQADTQKLDIWAVHMGAELAPAHGSLRLPVMRTLVDITTARTGANVLGKMVGGNSFDFEIVFKSTTAAEIRQYLSLASGVGHAANQALGAMMPKVAIRLHDPHIAADDLTQDIYFPSCVLHGLDHTNDGVGVREVRVPITACADPATGLAWHIGPVPEPEPEPE